MGRNSNKTFMKNFKILMLAAAVCLTGTFFIACDDAASPTPPVDNTSLPGVYKLTSFSISKIDNSTTPPSYVADAADLNGDSIESQNLTTESSCYGEGYIKFNSNHTYERTYSYGSSDACTAGVREAGVWNRSGDVITITASSFNGNPQESVDPYSAEFTYSEGGQTLSGSRVDIDNMIGTTAGVDKVDFIYTKQ